MANWSNPLGDLRTFLQDTTQSRYAKEKRTFPANDGITTRFYTFDDRLVAGTLGVIIDGGDRADDAHQGPMTVAITDAVAGNFTVTPAPAPPPYFSMRANYYYQLWLDGELQTFLDSATYLVGADPDTVATIAGGLRAAVLHLAGGFAYRFAAGRWAERKSAQFLVEEAGDAGDSSPRANFYLTMADKFDARGEKIREDFYKRQGRREAPARGRVVAQYPFWTPRR